MDAEWQQLRGPHLNALLLDRVGAHAAGAACCILGGVPHPRQYGRGAVLRVLHQTTEQTLTRASSDVSSILTQLHAATTML